MARKPATPSPTPKPADPVTMIKKPELLDEVVARTNLKKRDVKPTVEAAFAVVAEALRDGAVLNVPPLGKLRVVKTKALDGGASVMTLKLRTPKNATLDADNA
ncbi:DNA-binding protein HU-beta [Yoonia maricola]|uniref:DNA-binding protein HU-beta n=1 Tax=Yoonia maricola TaxID=420999 RepID=A0A2M8WKS2_9RHOB|nr:HU family DNA-binding protein [Yoonia maricola]PJI91524.1 DNA-binding protein HU-beta [Yoonia maricola]